MCAAARCDAAAGCVRCEGETAAIGGPAVRGSRARRGSVLLQEEREEAEGGYTAPPQRLHRTHAPLVQHLKGTAHR